MHHAYLHARIDTTPTVTDRDTVDLIVETYEKIAIDSVRELTERVATKPVGTQQLRTVIISAHSINLEAQNALLKLLEEPPTHTELHFVITDQARLLPTLLSRFHIVASQSVIETNEAELFLRASLATRLELVAEKTKDRDTAWQEEVLNGLEVCAAKGVLSIEAQKILLYVRQSVGSPGASAKMLLEHLALALPVLK